MRQQKADSAVKKLVLATHNAGKAEEIRVLLAPYGVDVLSAADLSLPEPEETGETFTENAVLKARAAAEKSGLPALADDSGLTVAALDGAPGIHSARWAGPERNFRNAMDTIHRMLKEKNATDRSAAFVSVLALVHPSGLPPALCEGRVNGHLIWPPRGEKGFGYDPFFVPEGHTRTFAEMNPEEKAAISHRTRAFEKLIETLLA